MIQLNNIHKTYHTAKQNLQILNGITLNIEPKASIAITGPSGSGKSTLLRILAGLDDPTKGDVHVEKINLYSLNDDERATLRSQTFGFIFQSFRLFPALTVLENVALGLDIKGEENSEAIAKQWIADVGLSNRDHHLPEALSGGEQQRVAIARALATSPKVIVADEPTGNLDEGNSESVKELLNTCIEKSAAALILVTHDLKLASMCKTQYKLSQGKIAT